MKEDISLGDHASDASLSDKVKSFILQKNVSCHSDTLKETCLKVIRQNFKELSTSKELTQISPTLLNEIVSDSSFSVPPEIAARHVDHEGFWKRQVEKCTRCSFPERGIVSWKIKFCERYVMQLLGNRKSEDEDNEILSVASAMQDYIYAVELKSVCNNSLLEKALPSLPNLLSLDLQYGNNINFSGMSTSDAKSLARTIQSLQCLCCFSLTNSKIDDDLVRLFVQELNNSKQKDLIDIRDTLMDLNLSHNKITTEGLRLITCYFLENDSCANGNSPILTSLKMKGNKIRGEGGRTLGRILKSNKSLQTLDMRMNRLEDDGGQLLIEGLSRNTTLKILNLSSNSLSTSSASSLCKVLEDANHRLESIHLSSNDFEEKDYLRFVSAMQHSSIHTLDLRGGNGSIVVDEALKAIDEKLASNREASSASNFS